MLLNSIVFIVTQKSHDLTSLELLVSPALHRGNCYVNSKLFYEEISEDNIREGIFYTLTSAVLNLVQWFPLESR